jgi:AraC-like DNA-binding protein
LTGATRDDLTGAALVSLMKLSFLEQGIDPGTDAPAPKPNTAFASLSAKERMAETVLARHGQVALLKVGQSVPRMVFNPIGAALLAANNGPDLLGRWSRLERYVHTRHPIIVGEITDISAVLDHRGNPADQPSPAMDLVLAGVIGGLLGAVGCAKLALTVGDGHGAVEAMQDGQLILSEAPLPSPTGLWRFTWEIGPSELPGVPSSAETLRGRMTKEATRLIESDLLKIWSLAELAAALGQSTRTLQRRFSEDGTSVQDLRRAAQIRKASKMLLDSKASLAAIGFACGFSDPAHFTRMFRKAAGTSPGEFRTSALPG